MKHVLFMCVANSARSQMAEGLARAVAPTGLRVSSAGSVPTHVRPEAVQVLEEIGIDIRAHHSKGVHEIELDTVDYLVTLCAEEVCPVVLTDALRIHHPLPDPATDPDRPESERLDRFRSVRDALRQWLPTLFELHHPD